MSSHNGTIGKQGEQIVVDLLTQRGFRIIGRNLHTRFGEVDIAALFQGVLHIIEVKTRTSDRYGDAAMAFTRTKLRKLKKAVWTLRQEKRVLLTSRVQFDCAAIMIHQHPTKIRIQLYWNIGEQDIR